MTRSAPPSGPRRLLRHLPGIAGLAGAAIIGMSLWRTPLADIRALLDLAGLPLDTDAATVAIGGGVLGGIVIWAAAYLVCGPGGWLDRPRAATMPPRRPLSYADLGPPPPREQPLPTDLDQPLSAFDPDAIEFRRQRSS